MIPQAAIQPSLLLGGRSSSGVFSLQTSQNSLELVHSQRGGKFGLSAAVGRVDPSRALPLVGPTPYCLSLFVLSLCFCEHLFVVEVP